MRLTRYTTPIDAFNRMFAEFDHAFRGWESDWGVSLPVITVPSVSSGDIRVYSDGKVEKHFKDGMLHREDGPAIIKYKDNGTIASEEYFLEGVKSTKEAVETSKRKKEDEQIHTVYLGHKKFKVTGKKLRELQEKLGLEED